MEIHQFGGFSGVNAEAFDMISGDSPDEDERMSSLSSAMISTEA
jgi:hypothetical protein